MPPLLKYITDIVWRLFRGKKTKINQFFFKEVEEKKRSKQLYY
jgi:hypothetical protein